MFNATVSSVVKDFTRIRTKLEKVISVQSDRQDVAEKVIEANEYTRAEAGNEIEQAQRIIANLDKLLAVD